MTNLKELDLNRNKITDAGLVHLKGLTSLQFLDLSHTQITDTGLVHLIVMAKHLRGINLISTQVSDKALAELRRARVFSQVN
jgi:Leucine-rich repeat (LRR) protein